MVHHSHGYGSPLPWYGSSLPWCGSPLPWVWFTTPMVWFTTPMVWFTTHMVWFTTPMVWFTTPIFQSYSCRISKLFIYYFYLFCRHFFMTSVSLPVRSVVVTCMNRSSSLPSVSHFKCIHDLYLKGHLLNRPKKVIFRTKYK